MSSNLSTLVVMGPAAKVVPAMEGDGVKLAAESPMVASSLMTLILSAKLNEAPRWG